MQFKPTWKHLATASGVVLSFVLPQLFFREDEYEYIEIVDEEPIEPEETEDDQQED